MSPILVTLTSRCYSDFECWNISFSEIKLDGVDQNSNCRDNGIRKNRGKNSMVFDRRINVKTGNFARCDRTCLVTKTWFPYSRYQSLGVVDGLSQSLEYLGRWESLPVVGGLSGSLTVFHGR